MITVVCGFGRCGSSLVMQMLAFGGMETPYSEYPSYEIANGTRVFTKELVGGAIKILDPHLKSAFFANTEGYPRQFIWIDRNTLEQAKSMAKFFSGCMPHLPAWTEEQIKLCAESFKKDRPKAVNLLHRASQRVLKLRFEEILAHPQETAEALSTFCGGNLLRAAMADRVIQREPGCLPYLLELEQLADWVNGPA